MSALIDTSDLSESITELSDEIERNNIRKQKLLIDTLEYGLPLREVYKLAFRFYREKEGKAVQLSYEDKLQLVAFSQQIAHGPLSTNKLQPVGALDVVGKDRREAWQKLGGLSGDEARAGFVELLSRRCHLFAAYVEAHRREKTEQERRAKEKEKQRLIDEKNALKQAELERVQQEQLTKEEQIRRQIQHALNEQTYDQFRQYADQQYPGDPEKQSTLVRQLQEQHYVQYIQQLEASQKLSSPHQQQDSTNLAENDTTLDNEDEEDDDASTVYSASMWTRKDIQEFKKTISKAQGDGVLKVNHGETVTVRVPTHVDGTRLFWEFATDYYDIGFGIYFEFGKPLSTNVTVHITESDDEDDEVYDEGNVQFVEDEHGNIIKKSAATKNGIKFFDIESQQNKAPPKLPPPLLTEIVPVYRRDCQTEVYAGSHPYPGQGVYMLKFDNSYSLWRSKRLYYRVYYTK